MKRNLLITSLICFGIAFLALSLMAFDDPGARVWTGPPLGGEWLLNEETGEYWYLHSNAEFDLIGDGCLTCHKEMSRTEWYCGDAWYSFYEF